MVARTVRPPQNRDRGAALVRRQFAFPLTSAYGLSALLRSIGDLMGFRRIERQPEYRARGCIDCKNPCVVTFWREPDIVDGLTWLRMAFSETGARYLPAYAAMSDPMGTLEDIEWRITRTNFSRLVDMQTASRRFLRSGEYDMLSGSKELSAAIKELHGQLLQSLNGGRSVARMVAEHL